MDLLTQGLLGGALALAASSKKDSRTAAATGFFAGLVADADVLINIQSDPLLNVEFHRHFTHALVFIPVGAFIAALILLPFLRNRLKFKTIYFYAFLGYATSGLLDACTSYGTHLLWPFSDDRIAWSIISIVDPVFSITLLISLIIGVINCKPFSTRIGLALSGTYLLLGVWQHQNVLDIATELAKGRGHNIHRIVVKPTIANLFLWRSVYQAEDRFYIDAIHSSPRVTKIYPGSSIDSFEISKDLPSIEVSTILAHDIKRFSQLTNGFVVADPNRENVLIDVRYSMLPTSVTAMWGIDLNVQSTDQHVNFTHYRDRPPDLRKTFTTMLLGNDLPD